MPSSTRSSEPPSDSESASPTGTAPPSDTAPSDSEPPVNAPPGITTGDWDSVSPPIRNVIAVVITAVWALGMVADAAMSTFALPSPVHAIMLGLATAVFGSNFVKGLRP